MKIKLSKSIIGALAIIFALTGCSNNSDELASVATTKNDILTFANSQAFDSAKVKVASMKPEERVVWENSKGFKSLGTICDEFYKTIEPQNFKTMEDVNAFVSTNGDKVKIYENKAGDKYLEVQEFDNSERYLMNKDKMYIVGTTVFRKFDEATVSTDIANIAALKVAKNYSDLNKELVFGLYKAAPTKVEGDSHHTEIYAEGDVHDGWFGALQSYRLVVRLTAETVHSKVYNDKLKIFEATSTNNHYLVQVSNYVWHVVLVVVTRKTSYDISMENIDDEQNSFPYHYTGDNVNVAEKTLKELIYKVYDLDNTTTGVHITSFHAWAENDKNCSFDKSGTY